MCRVSTRRTPFFASTNPRGLAVSRKTSLWSAWRRLTDRSGLLACLWRISAIVMVGRSMGARMRVLPSVNSVTYGISSAMVAAFYDEVKSEADNDDWPLALRDRLGLGHYGTDGGRPLAVALMLYPLAYVLDWETPAGRAVCSLPTVLDNGMHEFLFPVPREHRYGATLHLEPHYSDTLTSEVLHRRVDYRAEHVLRLGWIGRGHELAGAALVEARDLHLMALQIACTREDFGEPLGGRT